MIAGLTFDEATHTYAFEGRPVPGVTSILAPLMDLRFVNLDVLNAAAEFGTAVHLACELYDKNDLDEATLDPALVPYLAGWKAFSADHAVAWTMIEERVFHSTHVYAGTLDRFGTVDGDPAVVDIKSGAALYPSVGPQLAAYKNAINPVVSPLTKRLAVQLKADGTYTLKAYTHRDDWSVFLSMLTLRQWCERNAVTPNF